jgi:hypothetical protein
MVILAASSGCTQNNWDEFAAFFKPKGDPVQPGGQRGRRTASRRADRSAGSNSRADAQQGPDDPAKDELDPQVFYRLELINEPSSAEAPPRVARLWFQSAPAGSAAKLIELLYVPIGTGGSEIQHYLVYQSSVMWTAAADIANAFDVRPADQIPARVSVNVNDTFRKAVAVAQIAMAPGKLNKPALDNAVELFNHVAVDESASPKLRWAAAVLAGRLLADFAFDPDAAAEYFYLAQGHAPDASVERMTALYYRAEIMRQTNRPQDAQPILDEITERFDAYADTNLYQRCQRLAMK